MYFPLIERRIAARRISTIDRRQSQKSQSLAGNKRKKTRRRKGNERRTLILDRETLLYASLLNNGHDPERAEQKSKLLPICSAILIPLIIGGFSILATNSINDKQMESAKLIAKQQKESAELIAKGQQENAKKIANANIKNSKTIADAQMETQHLQHLVSIFSSIISPEKKADKNKNVIHQRIRSLSVYDDEALPFLLQIRQHFSEPGLSSSQQSQTWRIANQTIGSIVGYSQLDLSGQTVISLSDTPINLRHKEYANYNLDNSHFTNVNLYKADFSGSSLQNSSFTDADLQETKFNNANLKGVFFKNSLLRKTNFRNAYLSGVTFSPDCKFLEHAIFSLNTLLKLDSGLFNSLGADKFALLLMPHESDLERINVEEKSKLDEIFAKLNIETFNQLKEKFTELRNQGLASIEDRPKATRQVSMNSL